MYTYLENKCQVLEALPLKLRTKQECPLRCLPFSNLLEVLDDSDWELRGVHVRIEKIDVSQFSNDLTAYLEKPRE